MPPLAWSGERAREGGTHASEKLGSEKLADLWCLRVSKSMKMVAHRYTVVIGLGGMLVALATLITAEAAEAAPIAYNV